MQEKFAFVSANVKHFNFPIVFLLTNKINLILDFCNAKVPKMLLHGIVDQVINVF